MQKIFITFCFAVIVFVAAQTITHFLISPHRPALDIARSLSECVSDKKSTPPNISCIRKTIQTLLKTFSARQLMRDAETHALPKVFNGCHSIGHMIGSELYLQKNDTELALRQCPDTCGYACAHGAIGEAVSAELGEKYPDEDIAHASGPIIEKIGAQYCRFGKLCHAIGHLLFIAYDDTQKALNGCARLTASKGIQPETCETGVFMQAAGGIENALVVDGDNVPPNTVIPDNDYLFPCDTLANPSHACFLYLSNYERILFKKNKVPGPDRIAVTRAACESLEKTSRANCFEGIGRHFGPDRLFVIDGAKMTTYCDQFETTDDRRACVLGRINWMGQFNTYPEAADYCSKINPALQPICYNAIFEFIDMDFGVHQDIDKICPAAQEKDLCASRLQDYEAKKSTLPRYFFGLYGKAS